MNQLSILFDLGRRLRDKGMAQVEENSVPWRDHCKTALNDWFANAPSGVSFTGEDLRLSLQSSGIEEPHHPNAWSAVVGGKVRQWLKAGAIVEAGMEHSKDPKAHARRVMSYIKV